MIGEHGARSGCVPDGLPRQLDESPWDGHEFACCLTHDIDRFRQYASASNLLRSLGSDILRRGDLPLFARRLVAGVRETVSGSACISGLKWLLAIELERGVTASYFFMTADRSQWNDVHDPDMVAEWVARVEQAGMEAGLHPGYTAAIDMDVMRQEKARFDAMVTNKRYGVRQHYLHLVEPDTWKIQAQNGFLYDCSYGWREKEGFRAGTAYPFRPVDARTGEEIGIWEIPLAVLDGALALYRSLSPEEGFAVMRRLVQEVKRVHGVFCLLWHNHTLDDVDWRGWRGVYLRILDHIQEQGGWIAGGRDIIDRWEHYCGLEHTE